MFFIYGRESCPYCVRARDLLKSSGEDYKYITIRGGLGNILDQWSVKTNGSRTIPLIFKDNYFIGGYVDLGRELARTDQYKEPDDF